MGFWWGDGKKGERQGKEQVDMGCEERKESERGDLRREEQGERMKLGKKRKGHACRGSRPLHQGF